MSGTANPKVHIVSNVRARECYVPTYIHQIQSLSTRNCSIEQIILVCDDVSDGTIVSDFAKMDDRVRLIKERSCDKAIKTIEEKAVQ